MNSEGVKGVGRSVGGLICSVLRLRREESGASLSGGEELSGGGGNASGYPQLIYLSSVRGGQAVALQHAYFSAMDLCLPNY